jgi:hypothetical protein
MLLARRPKTMLVPYFFAKLGSGSKGDVPVFPWAGEELHHESKRLQIFEVWVQLFSAASASGSFLCRDHP